MENLVVSMLCGVMFGVNLLGAYFAWAFVKSGFGFVPFILSAFMYKLSLLVSAEITSILGVRNDGLLQTLLLIPIFISFSTTLFLRGMEKKERKRIRNF